MLKKLTIGAALISLLIGAMAYWIIFPNNVSKPAKGEVHLFNLAEGADFQDLVRELDEQGVIKSKFRFKTLAKRMNLQNRVFPGEYEIQYPTSNKALIQYLRQGSSNEITFTLIKTRTKERFAEKVDERFGLIKHSDILPFLESAKLLDSVIAKPFKDKPWTKDNVLAAFLPNSYRFYKSTDTKTFLSKMQEEYIKWWSEGDRLEKANAQKLLPVEVIIVASIVEEESVKSEERPTIAGLYLNRLHQGWKLQADPTIKFALNDFALTRILFRHIDEAASSPYSTYEHMGLPPGPICIPSMDAIKAVLNAEKHDYMYMCAKDDFSGYHAFAKTKKQHDLNAARYHAAMNRRGN